MSRQTCGEEGEERQSEWESAQQRWGKDERTPEESGEGRRGDEVGLGNGGKSEGQEREREVVKRCSGYRT